MPLRIPALLTVGLFTLAAASEHVVLLGTYTDTESRGIYAVRLDGDSGAVSAPELVAELPNPEFLALHPDGRTVYALTRVADADGKAAGGVAAFALDAASGALKPLNTASTGRGQLCHIAVDATGGLVMVASYGDPYVASFPLATDGRIGAVATVREQSGPLGPRSNRQNGPHPHSVTVSPDNRFAFVADLGTDRIFAYALDTGTGTFAPHVPAFTAVAAGAGPRHTKFSPDGRHFYILNELDCTVSACRHDAARGTLEPFQSSSTLPDGFTDANSCSEIRVHPSGRFVYAANRGHDSIAVFVRDPDTGTLRRVEIVPTGGARPRNFALSRDGAWLLAAHQDSGNLTVFKVDAATGRLTATPHTAHVPKAVCVLFVN